MNNFLFLGSIFIASCGMAFAWVSPVLKILMDPEGEIRATADQISWIAVDIDFGQLITPFIASYSMDKFGRKRSILGCVPIVLLSWILVLTTSSVTVLYVKRILDGMVIGIVSTIAPVYMGEIATANTRGGMMISLIVSWYVGSLFQICIGTYLSYKTAAWLNLVLPVLFFVIFSQLPDTPYYLMMKHQEVEAAKSLAWFRDTLPNQVTEELILIKEYLEEDMQNKKSSRHVLTNKVYRKCFFIMTVAMLATTMTGLTTIFSYASEMFAQTDAAGFLNADTCSIIIAVLLLFISIVITLVIDKVGRRPLVLISGCGCFLSHTCSAFYFYFQNYINCNWIPLVTIGSYCFFVAAGLSPTLKAFQGELFPTSIKSAASGLSVLVNTCISIVTVKLYYIINVRFGVHFNYILYASVAGFATIWLYFYAPETKNKMLSELYTELQGKSKREDNINYSEELNNLKQKE